MNSLHHLPARASHVHWGYFDAALAPALRVNSGDLIRAEAVTHHAGDAPDLMMDAGIRESVSYTHLTLPTNREV